MIKNQFTTISQFQQLELFDPPADLAQRMNAIYDRAAMRFRQHEDAQHARIVNALQDCAVVQSGNVGGVLLKRVIVPDRHAARREKLLSDLAQRFSSADKDSE